MRHRSLLVLFACLIGATAHTLSGQETPTAGPAAQVSHLLEEWDEQWNVYRFGHDYERAIQHFEERIEADPEHPLGYLSLAVMYCARLVDMPLYEDEVKFYDYIELAIKKSEAMVNANERDADGHFYLGGSLGYKAIYDGITGRWWSAFWTGRRGVDEMRATVALDSTLYDAYYGLGLFDYWQARKSRVFWWLPFLGDNRERGIKNLKVAVQYGSFTKAEAQAALVYIYVEEEQFEMAIPLAEDIYNQYAYSRFFQRCLADTYLKGNYPAEAEKLYVALLENVKQDPQATKRNIILHRLNVAKAQFKGGKYAEAVQGLQAIVNYDYPDTDHKMALFERYYDQAKDYLKEAQRKLNARSK